MSELRQDLISGDWTIIAADRARRPLSLEVKKKPRVPSPKKTCPFEDLQKSGNWPPLLAYPDQEKWKVVLIPNKFPALTQGNICSELFHHGIYKARTAVGHCDLVVTRDHNKNFADLDAPTAKKLFEMFQVFHGMAADDPCAKYVATFCNWGPAAGASLWHPHYQTFTVPIIPPHNMHSLKGAEAYLKKNGRCARCDIVRSEKKENVRVVEENESAIAIVPYASKHPFEVSIIPKKHAAYFSKTSRAIVDDAAILLQSVLRRMKKYLNDPDFNFFIHDAPLDHGSYNFHHWHIEVVPVNVVSPPGGFEASTIVNINIIDPDHAAAVLRGKRF